jgi:tetratricopeptide (TPR) repeat protein
MHDRMLASQKHLVSRAFLEIYMKYLTLAAMLTAVLALAPGAALSQTDELRAATGLPIKIGEPAVFGQVSLRRFTEGERRPVIFVSLLEGGSLIERTQVDKNGWYMFRRSLRGSATLILEIDDNEYGRLPLAVGANPQIRQDFQLDWQEFKKQAAPGVVSVKDTYSRTPEAAKAFNGALKNLKDKNLDKAAAGFKDVIAKDPKDYVAWTELGTIYFKQDNLNDAEACYFKAIEQKKDYFVALLNLGKLYVAKKQPDNAIMVLSNAVKVNAGSADAQHFLGESYLMAKKGSLAVTHLNEAIRLAPDEMAEVHLRLGALYDAAKMKDRAVAEYKAFLAKKPTHPEKERLEKYIAENSK